MFAVKEALRKKIRVAVFRLAHVLGHEGILSPLIIGTILSE